MGIRDDLFEKFGPHITEGLIILLLEQVNELRVKAGLVPYTPEQVFTAIKTRVDALEPYTWMINQST